jgi:glycerol uptake facilitator protein
MSAFLSEFLGTMFLIILGNGVVANVLLSKTKGNNAGLLTITFGWAIAVFVGVYIASHGSKAHLNPAITIAFALCNNFPWADVPAYIAGQFCGAFVGSTMVWLAYKQHYDETTDAGIIQATFCNAPAINNKMHNLITEIIGTFVLVAGVLFMTSSETSLGTLNALPVALLVLGIGVSLGGPTGYAINPARDLGPRIMHALLPIKNKGSNGWSYSWIPVVGPLVGAVLATIMYRLIMG